MSNLLAELEIIQSEETPGDKSLGMDNISVFDPVDTVNNQILLAKGIKDDSPEILAISDFKSMYEKEAGSSFKKNSSFDFMLFQNQLDLIIKEIINQKIENDPILKQRILEKYKSVLNKFKNKKEDLELFYLNVINVFDLFNIEENLKSKIKNLTIQTIEQETSGDAPASFNGYGASAVVVTGAGYQNSLQAGDISSDVASLGRHLGFDFNEEYLLSFLSSHSPELLLSNDSKFVGNNLYRNLIEFIYNTYFDVPDLSFSKDSELDIDNISMRMEYPLDFSNFIKEIIIASRANYTDFNNDSLRAVISNLSDSSNVLNTNATFEEFQEFGKSMIGDKDNLSSGENTLINQANLYTSDSKNVQVYNSVIDNSEPEFQNMFDIAGVSNASFITGKNYFSKDLISKILTNDTTNSDMLSYASKMLSKVSKIENFIFAAYKQRQSRFYNSIINEVASAANAAFKIHKIVTSEVSVTDSPGDVLGSLIALNYLGENPSINAYVETAERRSADLDNFSFIEGDRYVAITPPDEDFLLIDLEKRIGESGKYNISSSAVGIADSIILDCKITRDEFNAEKSDNNQLEIQTIYYQKQNFYLDAFSRFFDEIERGDFFKNSYMSNESIYRISLKILIYLFKDFRFRFYPGSGKTFAFVNDKGLESLFVVRDLLKSDNMFETPSTLPFREKIFGRNRPDVKFTEDRVRELYRQTNYAFFASYNIAQSLKSYYSSILFQVRSIGKRSSDISDLLEVENFNLTNIGMPTVERLVNLNHGYKNIFCPTTSFNQNMSYFPYKNTRTSNDLISINSFHKNNPRQLVIDENFEGMRIAAVGIPDGLINNLRLASGRSNNHTIIEISLLTLDHKEGNEGNKTRFTCRYKFLFNSCLHVNTINPDIDILSKIDGDDFSFEDILNVDDRSDFENFNLNEENLLSFNFGSINNKRLVLDTKKTFDESIMYNLIKYKIDSITPPVGPPEYTFNAAMSGKIIKNHVINYILKKNLEFFAGTSLNESAFPYFDTTFINSQSQESATLVNHFNQQDYTDDLKDYLGRTSKTSSIINPESFLIPAYGISCFERVFLLPCFKSRAKSAMSEDELSYESQFSFKSLIPVVRLL